MRKARFNGSHRREAAVFDGALRLHLSIHRASLKCGAAGALRTFLAVWVFSGAALPGTVRAASGTQTAAFLDIPVGAGPASMGAAYTALATDAYAPTWNPAGMPLAESTEISGQHVAYLQSVDYEYVSAVQRFGESGSRALGAAVQYLGTGDIPSTDLSGAGIGTFSSHFAAYSLAYAQSFSSRLSLGVTAKAINAAIGGFSADAYAFDLGALYPLRGNLKLAAAVSNIGTTMNFLSDSEPLPMEGRLGLAYQPSHSLTLAVDGACDRSRQLYGRFGAEWRPLEMIALRAGYRTDATRQLGGAVGVTAGLGLYVWGQEFAYAWVPYGDLGDAQYFSIVLRFGGKAESRRNLIYYKSIHRTRLADYSPYYDEGRTQDEEQQEILNLLEQSEPRTAEAPR